MEIDSRRSFVALGGNTYNVNRIRKVINKVIEHTNDLSDTTPKWFAIYVKYKTEKYVVDALLKKGVEAYVPLLSSTKVYTRKIKEVKLPLINCYAFVKITKEDYIKVLETEYVSGFLKIRRELIAIPETEINLLKRIVGELEEVEVSTENLEIGTVVEIIAGKLTGLQGVLLEKSGKHNFLIELKTLGFQLKMNINPALLRRLSRAVTSM